MDKELQTERVSARFTIQARRHLNEICKMMGESSSEALIQSVRLRYNSILTMKKGGTYKLLKDSGFIGSVDGPSDLSVSYKENLFESLKNKHSIHK